MRRTRLGRGKPMRRGPGPARRTRLRPMSAKRARQAPARRRLVAELVEERPWCAARIPLVCDGRAVDGHEPARRSQGGNYLDDGEVLPVCRSCHDWIGTHPRAAEGLGLAEWGWAYRLRRREA